MAEARRYQVVRRWQRHPRLDDGDGREDRLAERDVAFKQPGGATGEVRRVLEDEKGLGRGCRISGRHVVNGGSVAITSVAPSHDFVLTAEADFSKVPRQQTNLAFL